jgi:hypothetical protein
VEADLARYYQLDIRDRWRFDADGKPKLTLRMLYVRIKYLPAESATSRAEGNPGWTREQYLLAHIWGQRAETPHPWYPAATPEVTAEQTRAKKDALARKRQREQDIANGVIT